MYSKRLLNTVHSMLFSRLMLLYSNVTISVVLYAAGDFLEQQRECYVHKIEEWNEERTTRMAIVGGLLGVMNHYWYDRLDRQYPGRAIKTVLKKMFLDQVLASPIMTSTFIISMGLLERQRKEQIVDSLKTKGIRLFFTECFVWPVTQFVNFYWVRPRYRVLYDAIMGLAFDIFASKIIHD